MNLSFEKRKWYSDHIVAGLIGVNVTTSLAMTLRQCMALDGNPFGKFNDLLTRTVYSLIHILEIYVILNNLSA